MLKHACSHMTIQNPFFFTLTSKVKYLFGLLEQIRLAASHECNTTLRKSTW